MRVRLRPWLDQLLRTFPFTLGLTGAVALIGILSATAWHDDHAAIKRRLGTDLSALAHLRVDKFLLSPLYQSKVGVGPDIIIMLLLFVGALEYLVGSWRAVLTFFASDAFASVATIGALAALGAMGGTHAHELARRPETGSSAGMFACAAAAGVLLPSPWREVGLAALYAFLLPSGLRFGLATWIEHLAASTFAAALSWRAWRPVARPAWFLPPLRARPPAGTALPPPR